MAPQALAPEIQSTLGRIIDALPFYVLVVDEAHTIRASNSAVYKALDRVPNELLGCHCPLVVHGVEESYPGCPLEEAMEKGRAVEKEFFDKEKGLWMESGIYPIPGMTNAGQQLYIHFVRDISPRKELEQALRELKNDLERQVQERTQALQDANMLLAEQTRKAEELRRSHEMVAVSRERLARVGELSAGIAHTIRNPLHGLLSSVAHLEKRIGGDDSDSLEVLAWMREGLVRMETVTRRLLTLTREAPLQKREVDLNAMVTDVINFVAERARGQGLVLRQELAPLPRVLLDPDRISEVLINLLDNAIDACAQDGTVVVRTRTGGAGDDLLVLEVQDTGVGISAELIPRVFDPFFTTKEIGAGSGLGLAIAQRVIEEHDGYVEIESEERVGTIVRVSLPATS